MPSTTKVLHFFCSALATSVSVGLLGFSMSTSWSESSMECTEQNTAYGNGSAMITMALFDLISARSFCPVLGQDPEVFKAFPELAKVGGAPQILHGLCVLLLVLCLVCSAGSILISLYNSISNPYETYMGPIGIYACNAGSACLSLLVLIVFALNVHVTGMPEGLARSNSKVIPVDVRDTQTQMGLGYFLVIPYLALSLLATGFIYLYQHAAYTHRREQQKPTEDAPKEIMMY
ncbi:unnamed protein product [Merluccius merluccius]|uniref:Clarin-3 n=1 Tax=Merluccius polli TaxID=89951 RepID=A0AA47NCR9_MERPO|nr:Clarin-3 [Merluccius polli]